MVRAIQGVATLGVVAGLVAAAIAVATGGGGPQVDQPTAAITFAHAKFKFRECDGQDGFYSENKAELTGTSTGDSRLAGAVRVEYSELVNIDQEAGPQEGRITIEDPATGREKADGKFGMAGPLDFTQGLISGRVRDQGSGAEEQQGDGALLANWRIVYGSNGSITAQIGGEASDNRLPTALWSGSCKGKFTESEFDLPAPDAVSAQSVGSARVPGR